MLATQTLNPQVVKQFLVVLKDILQRKFPEAKITSKVGKPRIGPLWVLVAICVITKIEGIVWRELPSKLCSCDFLVNEGI